MAFRCRPAIVVSADAYNQISQDGVFVLITTNTDRRNQYDLVIERRHEEFGMTGLRSESAVRIDKIFTLNKRLVAREIGKLGPVLQQEVASRLRLFFELGASV